jgi:hypothetical protein
MFVLHLIKMNFYQPLFSKLSLSEVLYKDVIKALPIETPGSIALTCHCNITLTVVLATGKKWE